MRCKNRAHARPDAATHAVARAYVRDLRRSVKLFDARPSLGGAQQEGDEIAPIFG